MYFRLCTMTYIYCRLGFNFLRFEGFEMYNSKGH